MATVRYYGELAAKMGIKEESYPGATVSQVLSKIKKSHGSELYHEAKRCHIIVDHCNAGSEKGFRTAVGENSVVEFVPVCGGG